MTKDFSPTAPTRPTELTGSPMAPDSSLAIAWVFPEPLLKSTPLRSSLVLGRSRTCDVTLLSGGTSRSHAELQRQGPLWLIKDCKSRNGTFLNGEQIAFAPLELGDVLRIGGHVGVVRPADEAVGLSELGRDLWGGDALSGALQDALRAAHSKLPIIIFGETGTGKEKVARAIHHGSQRSGPFIALNCGAISEQLAEAEHFGHIKGAFTGATSSSGGCFRAADGGTLLLDEVTELSPNTQTKLLRALQEQEVTPVGSSSPVKVDVRILAACHASVKLAVAEGRFRQDLYMRLAGLEVALPRLKDRITDVPLLFSRFVRTATLGVEPPQVEPKLVEALCVHDWPGNVRQLEMLVQRLLALLDGDRTLRRRSLPPELLSSIFSSRLDPAQLCDNRRDYDLARLTEALKETHGNLAAAAKQLNISRQRAYRILDGRNPRQLVGLPSDEAEK